MAYGFISSKYLRKHGRKARILIVDDGENIAELISLYLMMLYETKSDGGTNTTTAESLCYDLMLPGITAAIRCASRGTPICVLAEVFDKVGLEAR